MARRRGVGVKPVLKGIASICVAGLLIAFGGGNARAADKVALVIGNATYTQLATLNNTASDARAMAQALSEIGFETQLALDATEADLRKAIRNFTTTSAGADLAVVFYAGHGVQVEGENYILPTDFDLPRAESDIKISGLKVDNILAAMRSRTRVVLLDACRDNPGFGKRLAKSSRGVGDQGLAPMKAADISGEAGVFIAFATAAGSVAQDGEGGHSPFTQALLDNIKTPVSIDDMFSMVTKEVSAVTKNAQRPYKYASLDSIVCLTEKCGSAPGPQTAALVPQTAGGVRNLTSGAIDPNDRDWLLVAWGSGARAYIAPESIKRAGERTVLREKAFKNDGSYMDMQLVFDCRAKTANTYAGATFKDGQKVPKSEYLFAPDVLPLQPITPGSYFETLAAFACGVAKPMPELTPDTVLSGDWVAVTLDASSIKWSVLPGSIKKSGDYVGFLAKEEIPDGAETLPINQIASIDAALPNLYPIVILKGAVNCGAAELKSAWSEGWTKDGAMTGKIAPDENLAPLKIARNKVTADIGHYVCTKAGRKLVIP